MPAPTEPLHPMMQQSLALARQARLICPPNPAVGCVLVDDAGQMLGSGHTQATGQAHAEVMALRDASSRGHSVTGATAYVTLEPCSYQGRTPPCCDALIAAGIKHVVAALADPNPLVSGQGFARLRAAGISVDVGPGAHESRELNIGFFSRMIRKTPWVRMKMAASLDGTTALSDGRSQWITQEAARADGHAWRARACAVLTGIGTVLQDNPSLNVRYVATPRQPTLVVVDSQLQLPLDAHLFIANRSILVYAAVPNDAKKSALEARGATVIYLPTSTSPLKSDARSKVDLKAMLSDLAQRQINEVHVEAGSKLNGSLLRENLVDELLVYLAPKLMGQGINMANLGPLADLSDALPLEFKSVEPIGADLRVLARVAGRDNF